VVSFPGMNKTEFQKTQLIVILISLLLSGSTETPTMELIVLIAGWKE